MARLSDPVVDLGQTEVIAEIGVVVMPSMSGIEAVAGVLANLGVAWASAPPGKHAAIPPLMLKAAAAGAPRIARHDHPRRR